MIYIGLPQWSHPKWVRLGITSLEEYARHFNCVEGNTTLYALPKPEIVTRWYEQTHDDFRFCFKFPATISHQAALRHCDDLSSEFFDRLAPLASASASIGCSCRRPSVLAISPRYGIFSTGCRRISPTASRFVTPNSSPKAKRNSSSTAGCTSATLTV